MNKSLSLWTKSNQGYQQTVHRQLIRYGDRYELLKASTHLPFLLKTLAQPEKKTALSAFIEELETLLKAPPVLQPEAKSQEVIYRKTVMAAKAIVAGWKQGVRTEQAILSELLKDLAPELSANCKRAADIQIQHLDNCVREWLGAHSLNLATTRVIIAGPQGPRNGLIEKQYFVELYQQLLAEKDPENDRVYYAESLPKHLQTIDIEKDLIQGFLRNAETNKEYGEALNGNKKAMFRDVLSEHATEALQACPFHKKQ